MNQLEYHTKVLNRLFVEEDNKYLDIGDKELWISTLNYLDYLSPRHRKRESKSTLTIVDLILTIWLLIMVMLGVLIGVINIVAVIFQWK